MNKASMLKTLIMTTMLLLPIFSNAVAQEETSAIMTINRFVTCQDVQDREPVGATDVFAAGTETAYAFLEAAAISADVQVSVVWFHENGEVARVPLMVRQGNRWRTYSSKQLAGRSGTWRVEVQDAKASILASHDFTVE